MAPIPRPSRRWFHGLCWSARSRSRSALPLENVGWTGHRRIHWGDRRILSPGRWRWQPSTGNRSCCIYATEKTWSWTSSRLLSRWPRKCCPISRRSTFTLSPARSICSPDGSTVLWTFWLASVGYLCRVRRVRLLPGVCHSNVWLWNRMPLICPHWPQTWTARGFSVITPRSSLGPGTCLPRWC